MASAIDVTKPVAGNPTTESVRLNFAAAKSEIEILQQTAGVGPQGPIGNTGPAGTVAVGTVTTGLAGSNATVTNVGTAQAATLNFTIPRGDMGAGGGGITETQAVDAVRQGNPRFEESPATAAPTWPTTPNIAGVPERGAGWTPETGGTATSTYTHAAGSTDPLAYPAPIANGDLYQIVWTQTPATATGTSTLTSHVSLFFRNGPTVTTGQQTIRTILMTSETLVVQATGNFSHFVVVPVSAWAGNFTLTRLVRFSGSQNSSSLNLKDWAVRVKAESLFISNNGGRMSTGAGNIAIGQNALSSLTTGVHNIAIGNNTLSQLTIGGNTTGANIAIGLGALPIATTGHGNVAIGSRAMSTVTTGQYNVALGDGCLMNVRESWRSVAIGRQTAQNQRAEDNTAVGCQTLTSNTTGIRNSGFGGYALYNVVGNNNTGVGFAAARYATGTTPVTAADQSTYIGSHARASAATGVTNEIVIGYEAQGGGSDTVTLGNGDIAQLRCNVQTISTLSDSRVKDEIELANLDRCLAAVMQLPVHRWHWQPIAGFRRDRHVTGFLSGEVKNIFPKAVTVSDEYLVERDEDGRPILETIVIPPSVEDDSSGGQSQTIQMRKTTLVKDVQRVELTEIVPTLWGAVQLLIQKNEEMQKQLDQLTTPAEQPESKPAEQSKHADQGKHPSKKK